VPVEMTTVALLLGAGLLAGTLNSIAGGGSLMTIPLLIFIGLPPTVANATNRIAIFIGGVGATQSFHRRGLIPLPWVRLGLPPALAGVVIGIWGATRIGDVAFERVLAAVLVVAAAWIIWHPVTPPDHGYPVPPRGTRRWVMIGAFFLVGVYSGFIQAGVGFVFLALMSANGLDLVRGNAFKAAMILVFTGLAVVLFALSDMLDWIAGLNLAAGQFFGAKLGVHLQVLKGQAWVRNVLTVAILAFAVRLLIGG
jgi:uncharacterized membrane protein YfcA